MSGSDRISDADVVHVARLARLSMSKDELASLHDDLDRILGYVDQLAQVDVDGVEPTRHAVELGSGLRPDEVGQPLPREVALAGAPDAESEAFAVPKVMDHD